MELIKAPNDFLEKKVQPFDFATMDAEKISKEMVEMMLKYKGCLLYTSPSPRDKRQSRMPSSA